METFFKFMDAQGASWWNVNVMCRTRDGQRGAPLAGRLGFRFAVHANRGVASFHRLESKLVARGRGRLGYDLMTRESPARAGRRVLLVDDLDGVNLEELARWWAGAVLAQETSRDNFQALVISPRFLPEPVAKRALRALAVQFYGDLAAAGLDQLHRLPGSKNWKPECIDAGGPFTTRLVFTRELRDADLAMRQIEELGFVPVSGSRARRVPVAPDRGQDNSSMAFCWTLRELRRGTSETYILEQLATRWLAHHDPQDWPRRTLENVKFALGWRSTRYASGE